MPCQGPPARPMGETLLRANGRMALPWRGKMVCLSVARPRKGPTSFCEALPPPAPARRRLPRTTVRVARQRLTEGLTLSWQCQENRRAGRFVCRLLGTCLFASARRLFQAPRVSISASATDASFKISSMHPCKGVGQRTTPRRVHKLVRIKSTARPRRLVVDCLGDVSRQVLGSALPRTTGPVDGRSLAED